MSPKESKERNPKFYWFVFITTIIIVFILGLFASSIIERKAEKVYTMQMVKPIADWEPRNEIWGANFPREYETYLQTLDTNFASKHGGSVTIDYLEKYPELVILWAGYGFSKDYLQGRGHAYAIKDIRHTLRTGGNKIRPMVSACWTCKSTDVPRLINEIGAEEFYKGNWLDKGEQIINPIGCQDCHENTNMDLHITRPALVEAFERQGKDITTATHNEMRSLVCAQCHVEYYFKGEGNYLTFPWDKGSSVDDIEKYYDESNFSDWTHSLSKAPMLKAQHPDYELFRTGIHFERGVSCPDCHMPYKSEGGVKFTNHHITSPLQNPNNSCQVCHREETETIIHDVYERQEKVEQIRRLCEKTIAIAHIEAKISWDNGATEQQMEPILTLIRHAQFRWDYVAAANGMGFHSPAEALRILGTSIQKGEEARRLLAVLLVKLGVNYPPNIPDYSTKDKAQKFIGLDMKEIINDKIEFLKTTAVEWDKKAKERQGSLIEY